MRLPQIWILTNKGWTIHSCQKRRFYRIPCGGGRFRESCQDCASLKYGFRRVRNEQYTPAKNADFTEFHAGETVFVDLVKNVSPSIMDFNEWEMNNTLIPKSRILQISLREGSFSRFLPRMHLHQIWFLTSKEWTIHSCQNRIIYRIPCGGGGRFRESCQECISLEYVF